MNERDTWEKMYPWDDLPHPKRVSVYIWEKGKFDVTRTTLNQSITRREKTVGHIALETFEGDSLETKNDRDEGKRRGIYVSFNPEQTVNTGNFIKPFNGKFHTYLQDYEANYHLKPKRIDLYTLNPTDIHKAFIALRNNHGFKIWLLFGSSIISPLLNIIGISNSNCCGVTYYLLREGGADFRTHHFATDFLYPLMLFNNFTLMSRKFIYYANSPENRSYVLADDVPTIIEDSYDYLLSSILVDFIFNIVGKNLSWSATDFLLLLLYSKWAVPEVKRYYNPAANAHIDTTYNHSAIGLGAIFTLIWFMTYHGTHTPKNIVQFTQYINELEKGNINFLLSHFIDIKKRSNKSRKFAGSNRDNASNIIGVIYFLSYLYREYIYLNNKTPASFSLSNAALIFINAFVRAMLYRVSINHRPVHVSMLIASLSYSAMIKFSFARKLLCLFPDLRYLSTSNRFVYSFLERNNPDPTEYVITRKNNYLINVFRVSKTLMVSLPLIPPLSIALFYLANELLKRLDGTPRNKKNSETNEVSSNSAQQQSWCSFFYNEGRSILTTALRYSPLVVSTYLAVSAVKSSDTMLIRETATILKK